MSLRSTGGEGTDDGTDDDAGAVALPALAATVAPEPDERAEMEDDGVDADALVVVLLLLVPLEEAVGVVPVGACA
jgi:hypothetical protein